MSLDEILSLDSGDAVLFKICKNCGACSKEYGKPDCLCGWYFYKPAQTVGQILDGKRQDRNYDRLLEDIREKGCLTPIRINRYEGRWIIQNGNHRIAAAAELGIAELAVDFNNESDQGKQWTRSRGCSCAGCDDDYMFST